MVLQNKPQYMAFDGENGPNFIPETVEFSVLLQIAFDKEIYLIDIHILKDKVESFELLAKLLQDFDIVKLGI